MEFDALEIIAILFFYFLFLWGFRFLFIGGMAKLIGGMFNGKKGSKVSESVGEKEKNDPNGYENS